MSRHEDKNNAMYTPLSTLTFFTPGNREHMMGDAMVLVEHVLLLVCDTATVLVVPVALLVFVTLGDGRMVGTDPEIRFLFALKPSCVIR
jgi:hypothetical protein